MQKIPVWKNILLIFSLIVAIIIATFAWFFTDPRGGLDNIALKARDASFIEISTDDRENWSDDLEMDIGINKSFKEVSGNGTVFYEPVYDVIENEDGELTSVITNFDLASGEFYYEQTFDIRSDANKKIYLSPESYIKALSDDDSAFIDGAIRVAFYELDDNNKETLRYIWAPNSTVQYSAETQSFTRDGQAEPYYYFQKSRIPVSESDLANGIGYSYVTVIPAVPTGSCPSCGYEWENRFMWSCGNHLPDNTPYLAVLQDNAGDEYFYTKMKVRVWLEGSDRECVKLLDGQKFIMKFEFDSGSGE